MEFTLDGRGARETIEMKSNGGTVDVAREVSSVTVPMIQAELAVNGEVREGRTVNPAQDLGSWSVRVDHRWWIALLVSGHYEDKPEIIAAHS